MIRGTAQLGQTEDIEITLTLTMNVREARELAQQQANKWPASDFSRVLCDLLNKTVNRVEREHASE